MRLDDRCLFLLTQLGFAVAERFIAELAPLGLHPAHFGVLTHLAETDGRSQQELADRLGVHRNAMVGLIDELEELGLVRRTRHPQDRRAHAVQLTERARAVLTDGQAAVERIEEVMLEPLDAQDLALLTGLLKRLVGHAGLKPGVHPGINGRRARRSGTSRDGKAARVLET